LSGNEVRRSPSITDVARLAGVSHQTVSRVLNHHRYVKEETRQRILAAIDELGYRPNVVARALATGRSRTIGLVTLDSTLFGPVSTLYGIERAARSAGYYVSIVSHHSHDAPSLREAVGRLVEQTVAGVILIAPLPPAFDALEDLPENLPLVVVEGDPEAALPAVTVDQKAGGRLATEHLLALGHATVHHVSGPPEWTEARQREAGWEAALSAAGRRCPEVIGGDWSARSGYEAGRQLLADGATAVFAANDTMALGLLGALQELHCDVPGAMSIVGFDDVAESAYLTPPLTTVRQDFDEVGQRSIELLVAQVQDDVRGSARVMIPPDLVVRASTAAPPRK
jgi:DNA-binding LacI/PurR family transcriptional regulator